MIQYKSDDSKNQMAQYSGARPYTLGYNEVAQNPQTPYYWQVPLKF